MKLSLLFLSTLVNTLLVGAGAAHLFGFVTLPSRLPIQPDAAVIELDARPALTTVSPRALPSSGPGPAFAWASVESQDYREYIRNLRQVGCPEETIADIIVADVRKLFAHERAPLLESTAIGGALSPATSSSQLMALDERETQMLAALLGQNWRFSLSETAADVDRRFPGQPKETVRQILELEQRFSNQAEALEAESFGSLTKTDRDNLRRLRQEKESAIAALLGRQGYEDYQIRSSSSVQALSQTPWFSFKDEQEFRAIAKAQVQWDQTMEEAEGTSEPRNQQQHAEKAFLEAVHQALGPERFAEFERARDYRYQQIASVATRYGLPEGTAAQVFAIRQELDTQLTQPTPLAAGADPTTLRQQTQEQIRVLLGDSAYATYAQLAPE